MYDEGRYYVYKHTLTPSVSGKENDMIYIGITGKKNVKQRWLNGKGYQWNLHFTNAIKKYGWDNFEHEILFEGLTKEEAEQKEIELIAYYDSTNLDKGYNLSLGGNSTGKQSEKTKRIISEKNKGKIRTQEFKDNLSSKLKGRPKPDGFSNNISERCSIPVICIETQVEYKSATEAKRLTGIDNSSITKCCNGKSKLAGGYHWAYKKDYNEEYVEKLLDKTKNSLYREVMCVDTRKIYKNLMEAERETGINYNNIRACCTRKTNSAGGLKWLFVEDATEENIDKLLSCDISSHKQKPVYCIELNKVFVNAKEAGKYIGITSSNITSCCKERSKSAGKLQDGTKLHWEYYKEAI